MSEPYNYRPAAPPQPGRPQGWTGTSKMPMQALGAPPQDLQPPGDYGSYPPPRRPRKQGGPGFLRDRGKLADYTLKGLGLLGVALVSGFLWYLIRNNPATPTPPRTDQQTQTGGQYAFEKFQDTSTITDCATHARGSVKTYLQSHACTSLTRSLWTTSLASSDKVITSVAVVNMPDNAEAKRLQQISDGNGTGHVKDLVEDGTVVPGGPASLQDAGYYSKVKGTSLVIVMTEYIDATKDNNVSITDNNTLKGVSKDAANQGLGGS